MIYENVNRATIFGFVKYMLNNPIYFRELYGIEATEENVKAAFKKQRQDGLVAAAHLPAECDECKRDVSACLSCPASGRKSKIVT